MWRKEDGAAVKDRIMEVLKEFDGAPTMMELSEKLKLGYGRVRSTILLDKTLRELAIVKGMRLKGARLSGRLSHEELVGEQRTVGLSGALCTARILKGEVGDGLVLDISNDPADGFQSAWNCLGWDSENIYTLYSDARVLTRFVGEIKTARFIAGSCEAVPAGGCFFDYVILTHIIHGMDDAAKIGGMVKEMNRVLKNGGILVITAPETYGPESEFFNQVKEIGFATSFAGSSVIKYKGRVHEKEHVDTFIQLRKTRETAGDAVVSPFFHLLPEHKASPSLVGVSEAKEAEVRKVARRFFWDPKAVSFKMSREEILAKVDKNKYEFIKSLRKLPINVAQEEALVKMLVRGLIPGRGDNATPANGSMKANSRKLKLRA